MPYYAAEISPCAPVDMLPRHENAQGSILFLRPEQIFAENAHKKAQNQNKIIRLATRIRRYGLSEPLLVRPWSDASPFSRYILAENEELWRAACLAGLERIPCVLLPQTPQNGAENAVFEQIRAGKYNIFEQAAAFKHLITEFHLTQEEVARRSGLSQSAVANKLRLLRLDSTEQREILRAGLGERHARALLRVTGSDRTAVLSAVIRKKLTVCDTERLIDALLEQKKTQKEASAGQEMPADSEAARCAAESKTDAPGLVVAVRERAPQGVLPRKFAMQSLQPLYNSIEKTLSIFRKTGRHAEMTHAEGAEEVCITIRIPTKV